MAKGWKLPKVAKICLLLLFITAVAFFVRSQCPHNIFFGNSRDVPPRTFHRETSVGQPSISIQADNGAKSNVTDKPNLNVSDDPILVDVLELNLSQSVREFLKKPVIYQHDYPFITIQSHVCKNTTLKLMFTVPSAPSYFRRRSIMRDSDLSRFVNNPRTMSRMLFFIGQSPNKTENELVLAESKKFGDIVIVDFPDIYHNILLKTLSILKWVSLYCAAAPYIIKNDDDIYGRVLENAAKAIEEQGARSDNFIIGGFYPDNKVPPERNNSRYAISEKEFPDKFFPSFTRGAFCGLARATALLLYEASLRVPRIWLDDVYLTGVCPKYIDAKKIKHKAFVFTLPHHHVG